MLKAWGFTEAPRIRTSAPPGFVEPMPDALLKGSMTVVKGPRKGKTYYYCLGDATLYFFLGRFYEKPVGGYLLSQFVSCTEFAGGRNSILLVHVTGKPLVLKPSQTEQSEIWLEFLARQIERTKSGEGMLERTIAEVFKMQTVSIHMSDPDGWYAFNEYLKKEYCSESTEFWKSLQTLRLLTETKDIHTQIETILESFILDSSPNQLNISGPLLDNLKKVHGNPKKYNPKLFDEAEVKI
eukprot:TRINITY_DN948_c0_g1_i12.p1 TRINITY_DN948_c0_g1~~TRINITY_DN948_c0_g1_i12.p1  ORF type:complete len:239 (-),score=26.24 TRINITY_DN948_c0_g1_i12:392-1108(-)